MTNMTINIIKSKKSKSPGYQRLTYPLGRVNRMAERVIKYSERLTQTGERFMKSFFKRVTLSTASQNFQKG